MRLEDGEVVQGCYSEQLIEAIGEGAYDATTHRNEKFLTATDIGPYPEACQRSWAYLRGDAALSYGLCSTSTKLEWSKMGPLSSLLPTGEKNRGVTDTKRN
jgi:hypothetical protein